MKSKLFCLLLYLTLISGCEKTRISELMNQNDPNRFQKITQYGSVMHIKAGPWHCVLDNKTGLLWENKTDDNSVHDSGWTYTYYEHDQSRDERESLFRDGSCESSNRGGCTSLALIEKTNPPSYFF